MPCAADRQHCRRQAGESDHSGIGEDRIDRHRLTVDHQRTRPHRRLVVREGGDRARREQHEVDCLEYPSPGALGFGLGFEQRKPVGRAGHLSVGSGCASGHRDVEHPQVIVVRGNQIGQPRGIMENRRAGRADCDDRSLDRCAYSVINIDQRVTVKVEETAFVERLWPARQRAIQRQFEQQRQVLAAARQRPDHGQCQLVAAGARKVLTLLRDDAPGRLVAPYPGEMRRDSHRATNVAAIFGRDHAAGQRRRRTA